MIAKLTAAMLTITFASTALAASPPETGVIKYAIENPLRPGAKAPHCPDPQPVIDGCTFHSVAGDAYDAHLPLEPREHWVASTPDPDLIKFQSTTDLPADDVKQVQVIRVEPDSAQDADTTVTFDRISGQPGAQKVLERRRINVMIHPA